MERNIIFFDDNAVRQNLLPLTFTRPTTMLRVGITTIYEKWTSMLGGNATYSFLTVPYLKGMFPTTVAKRNLMIAGHAVPTPALAQQALSLEAGQALMSGDELIAFNGTAQQFDERKFTTTVQCEQPLMLVQQLYHIFQFNGQAIEQDFDRLTAGRKSQPIDGSVTLIGDSSRLFIEEGASVHGCFLNTTEGPIYIGRDAEIMEGSMIRGPFAACNNAKARMGAKIYGATTLGPYCKVGGEVENTVMIGYSNKAHDGFIGDAVIGEWCNIGGGTTASNLKNDYSEVKLWNYAQKRFLRTGLQFCGLFLGDHCKMGVNCMINTATVMGVGVNLHGAGFPRAFVPSFSEGSATSGFKNVRLDAFINIARRVMARRGVELTSAHEAMYQAIYNLSKRFK